MSSNSDAAVRRAALLAEEFAAQCEVVHAADIHGAESYGEFYLSVEALQQEIRKSATDSLANQIARCWPSDRGQPLALVIDGKAVSSLPAYAAERDCDLVVLGSHGAGFFEKLLLGTTATRLIKSLTVPTLVVRSPPRGPYRKVLTPVDFSSYSEKTLHSIKRFFPQASLVLMHAFESIFEGHMLHAGVDESTIHRYRIAARDEAAQKIRLLAQSAGFSTQDYSVCLAHGKPYKEILTAEIAQAVDCIAIGKQGKGFVNELLLGSVTKHILLESQSDVLVQPA
jgi:nucleotide-binding universal stress UspA family protein